MSREEQRKQEEIKKLLGLYVVELREELNIRLFCETEEESPVQEQVLWIEDITLTEVAYPQNRQRLSPGRILAVWGRKIKTWFYNCIIFQKWIRKIKLHTNRFL